MAKKKICSGNEGLVQAIAQKGQAERDLLEVLRTRLKENAEVLLPVEQVEQPEEQTEQPAEQAQDKPKAKGRGKSKAKKQEESTVLQIRNVADWQGCNWMAAFTDEDEWHKGPETAVKPHSLAEFFALGLESEQVYGIVLNPWGERCYIPKYLLASLLSAVQHQEGTEQSK